MTIFQYFMVLFFNSVELVQILKQNIDAVPNNI